MRNSRIKDMRIYQATSEVSRPIADATHSIDEIRFYVVELETYDGVLGQGYILGFHYSPAGIAGALRDVKSFLLQNSYHAYECPQFMHDYEQECEYFGVVGLQRWALAAVNVAMWDAWARTLDQPVHRLLGCHGRRIPVYGSGGWLNYSDAELLEEVSGYKSRGFGAVKIKVGSEDMERDVRRLHLVREHVGASVGIMVDANQGMDVSSAIQLMKATQDIGIAWFEEPVSNTNFDGYASIHASTSVSLAMGEREYNDVALRELIGRRAIDLWQPDIIRIGGVEAWRSSASLAAAYHVPVLPHYYKDYDVPLLATVPLPFGAESFDWVDGIIDNPLRIENGFAFPREGPGWGFRFIEKHLTEIV